MLTIVITKPSELVLSVQGKEVQKKIWNETVILLQKERSHVDLDSFVE